MCRAKADGTGRRCPSHTSSDLIAVRNEVRREQYRAKKLRVAVRERLTEKGITHYTGVEADVAYFAGRDELDLARFGEVTDSDPTPMIEGFEIPRYASSKPLSGGLWTSPGQTTEDGTVSTRWTEHGDRGYGTLSEKTTPITVKKDAVIVRIDSSEDVRKLATEFPCDNGGFSYAKLAEAGVDGVHLSEQGLRAAKRFDNDEINAFAGWDIESTVWLNKDNLIPRKAMKASENQVIDEDDYYPWNDSDEDIPFEDAVANLQAAGLLDPITFD